MLIIKNNTFWSLATYLAYLTMQIPHGMAQWKYYVKIKCFSALGSTLSLGVVGHGVLEDIPDVTAFALVVVVTVLIAIHSKVIVTV